MINLREWALPVYTVMMQMAVGSMSMLWLIYTQVRRQWDPIRADQISHNAVLIIFITAGAAVVGSHFHLSRPLFSFLALSNLGTSWLSREVAFTAAFVVLIGAVWLLQHLNVGSFKVRLLTGWAAVAMGIATVYSMSQVYLLSPQSAWNSITTPVAFLGATTLLGGMAVSALLLMNLYLATLRTTPPSTEIEQHSRIIYPALRAAILLSVAATLVEIANYVFQIRSLAEGDFSARASLDLLLGLYAMLFAIRLGLLGAGVTGLMAANLWQRKTRQPLNRLLTPIYIAFLLTLVSEVLGRFLFYAIHVRTGI